MGRQADKKSTMTHAEREVVLLRIQLARLEDLIAGQPELDRDASGEMELYLTRDIGYWRLGRAQNGDFWVRWKWTGGPYKGHYEIGGGLSLFQALLSCLSSLEKVERGFKTPPYDAPYARRT